MDEGWKSEWEHNILKQPTGIFRGITGSLRRIAEFTADIYLITASIDRRCRYDILCPSKMFSCYINHDPKKSSLAVRFVRPP